MWGWCVQKPATGDRWSRGTGKLGNKTQPQTLPKDASDEVVLSETQWPLLPHPFGQTRS